ncbi:MAG: biopolymer transporter ExbD [Paraburkholderia sp.]|uniref:ExbD/TolR family protein n=1 Tax=Paraburkholderia sp. TaxID=1926495 RepID=UPI001203FEE7|nr:biopolymer transporter ExbD [Paraburkholderia sp.]TAM05314.1 MAG: biopolymer transporter ExbD [Paraburkholderia sp.]
MTRTSYMEVRKPHIEIIPMIDIMMFLLIFFMVTMLKMIDTGGLKISVPQAATTETLPKASLTIEALRDGTLLTDGHPVTADALTALIKERMHSSTLDVMVAGDKDVPLQALVHAMDIARAAGVEDLGIATKR